MPLMLALIIAGLIALIAFGLSKLFTRPRVYTSVPKGPGDPQDKIVLYDFAPVPGPISVSPFIVKAEAFLRFAGLDYTKRHGTLKDFAKAPKAKLPYIVHGANLIPDTNFIVRYLCNTYGAPMEQLAAPEDPHARAVALAAQTLVESHVYFGLIFFKYGQNWAANAAELARVFQSWYNLSWLGAHGIVQSLRGKIYGQAVAQGIARHSAEDVGYLMSEDISALAALLGDKPFLAGPHTCAADASLFGMLHVLLRHQCAAPQLADLVKKHPNLVRYEERIHEEFFGTTYRPSHVAQAEHRRAEG